MVVKLTEIIKPNRFTSEEGFVSRESNYILREIFINPEHVVCLREDKLYKDLLVEGRLMKELDQKQSFTKVYLNRGHAGIEVTIVGSPGSVKEKLDLAPSQKQLLKG